MPEEFEGDLAGSVFWGADLTGAQFRDVNLTNATITHAWLVDVDIDALVERVVINGVDVTDYVNEHDEWHPLRTMLRPVDAAAMVTAWRLLESEWAKATARATALGDAAVHEKVAGEWSFVQTLRHLVFAMDKWFTVPVLGQAYSPIGLPNSGSVDYPWPGLDYSLRPSLTAALDVRADRSVRFREFIAAVTVADLARSIDVPENGPHPLAECLYTVFEEEFWHLRYATRDLAVLEAAR